ncbi:MAG TPA: hypothetical protein PLA43_04725 [Bryobacteraceae bacterium]|nr:hypothetical protein [Bryobacteraceae bacterium]HOQ45165.1 hypothetical protein [Bryobacteraceae bacterium]HPQ15880.1 hypothetical protein [Bryobacteraceae bacterium]HPU71237.1 hypothetical protein [Bryobacteraceae bacterium]
MLLSLYNDVPSGLSETCFERLRNERVLERLRSLDLALMGDGAARPADCDSQLVSLGMELDGAGCIVHNSYGPLSLGWRTSQHARLLAETAGEAERLHQVIRAAHKVPLRFVVWAGSGRAVEDKHLYQAAGLLRRGPRHYVLDSTDPAKLGAILEDIEKRHGLALPSVLRSMAVVGIALETISPEAMINLERMAALYERHGIDSSANFLLIALPESQLENFGRERGYKVRSPAAAGADAASCRHGGPLTLGSLLPLALGKIDLKSWIAGAVLTDAQIHTAWRLASFIHAQSEAGRDKLTLLLPGPWSGAGRWTKREIEDRLGGCEDAGLKVVIDDRCRLANYRSPKDAQQDRAFLAVQLKGAGGVHTRKTALLRRSGYPVASVTFPRGAQLSAFMQFVHWTVFALSYLRETALSCRKTEPYRSLAGRIYAEAGERGGIQKTSAWESLMRSPCRAVFSDWLALHYGRLCPVGRDGCLSAPQIYAAIIKDLAQRGGLQYGEFAFFGDSRYSRRGAKVRRILQRAAEDLFGARLKMPADVCEGPPAGSHGKCLCTLVISEAQEHLPAARYSADHHVAQFLAARIALAERNRPAVAITLKNLEEPALESLGGFFRAAAVALRTVRL